MATGNERNVDYKIVYAIPNAPPHHAISSSNPNRFSALPRANRTSSTIDHEKGQRNLIYVCVLVEIAWLNTVWQCRSNIVSPQAEQFQRRLENEFCARAN
ncbi:hypothetical protein BofuT4_P068780.1 [Botrytis cinerea T4]|uniref:Uncharacterized protein n=1 Tax=Botryotinia fuckeliana (strain T4) TaxID=999810 RepID=G2XQS0_BOTF4|nr:hypothetical protein BofuT4_P068780.1 [Botrytis cinerea T4]